MKNQIDTPNEVEEKKRFDFSQINPTHLFWGMIGVTVCFILVGTCYFFQDEGTMPQPSPPPPLPETAVLNDYRYKETFYHSIVADDIKKAGLNAAVYDLLRKGNTYAAEFKGAKRLKYGASFETPHLKMQAIKNNYWVGEEGQGYRTEHLSLKITNKTKQYLAYRVITSIEGRCSGKGIIAHNALALKPQESVIRTECLVRDTDGGLAITSVEVMEISPVGYYYVSRLDPPKMWFDDRTSDGHDNAKQPPCKIMPWRIFQEADNTKQGDWIDVLDFYSRHNCDEYTYFIGYHWSEKGPKTLPVKPPS